LCLATDPDAQRYATWDKIAEGIGNLQALDEIIIVDHDFYHDQEDPIAPNWEILSCILRRLRRGVHLRMQYNVQLLWNIEALPVFTEVIIGQAKITGFSTGAGFPFDCLDMLCSALLTLPALENVSFEQFDDEGPEEEQSLDSMAKLLHSPGLREIEFESVVFTNTLCQAVAKVLEGRSEITDLHFLDCSFPDGGSAVIASALKTNTTLNSLHFCNGADGAICEVLAAALRSNSTLQDLAFSTQGGLPAAAHGCHHFSWLYK
jgi:hypothetical protein